MNLKRTLARNLRKAGNSIFDRFMDVADQIDGPLITEIDQMKSTAALLARIDLHIHHPCETCDGDGAIVVNCNDSVACPTCHGEGIDPAYLFAISSQP